MGRPPQKAGLGFGNRGETGNNHLAGNERTLPVARRRRIRRFARLCVAYFPHDGHPKGPDPLRSDPTDTNPRKGFRSFRGRASTKDETPIYGIHQAVSGFVRKLVIGPPSRNLESRSPEGSRP